GEDCLDLLDLAVGTFEDELVVDLENQLACEFFLLDAGGQADHGCLDDVRSAALDGCVDRDALGSGLLGLVRGVDFGNAAEPTGNSIDAAEFGGLRGLVREVAGNSLVSAEVGLDKAVGVLAADRQLSAES